MTYSAEIKISPDPLFVVIDDDISNNLICKININRVFKQSEVRSFEQPQQGLEFIQALNASSVNKRNVIVFLDLNMPAMNGFDVLDQITSARHPLPDGIYTYMLSSSIDPRDEERALSYNVIRGYITKPLTIEKIKYLLGQNS